MHGDIDRLVGTYEAGHISRRRLVTQLSAMTAFATTAGSASGAQPRSTGQDIAIKLLPEDFASDPERFAAALAVR
jgi:hypothetical protein